jgi:protein phosphatase
MEPIIEHAPPQDTLPHLRPRRPVHRAGVLEVFAAGATDPGLVRKRNEDQFIVAELSRSLTIRQCGVEGFEPHVVDGVQGTLLAVADGLGGHGGGDLASAVAIDALTEYMANALPWFWEQDTLGSDQVLEALEAALRRCQDRVVREAARHGLGHLKPGTTLTCAYLVGNNLYLLHAGDSRAYLHRDRALHRLTVDHTLAQQIADAEGVPVERVDIPRFHHVLSNAVGAGDASVRADVSRQSLERGDTLMLCTDGLTRHLQDVEIAAYLADPASPAELCGALISTARHRGGEDNVTAVIARV